VGIHQLGRMAASHANVASYHYVFRPAPFFHAQHGLRPTVRVFTSGFFNFSFQELLMTTFRFIPMALVISVASTLMACNTAPSMPMMPMAKAATPGTPPPDHLAHLDTQTKAMQAMHEKMMAAKTSEERNALMAEHMKSMQDGMKMMEGMAKPGMAGMQGMGGMSADMSAHHAMMEKRMTMMQTMMKMMMDRMPAAPAR
jgi:hypothetical protein